MSISWALDAVNILSYMAKRPLQKWLQILRSWDYSGLYRGHQCNHKAPYQSEGEQELVELSPDVMMKARGGSACKQLLQHVAHPPAERVGMAPGPFLGVPPMEASYRKGLKLCVWVGGRGWLKRWGQRTFKKAGTPEAETRESAGGWRANGDGWGWRGQGLDYREPIGSLRV